MHKMGGIERLWDQSTKFGTVIVFDEVINFLATGLSGILPRGQFLYPEGRGGGYFLNFMVNLLHLNVEMIVAFGLRAPNLMRL